MPELDEICFLYNRDNDCETPTVQDQIVIASFQSVNPPCIKKTGRSIASPS